MSSNTGSLLTKKIQDHDYSQTVYSLMNSENTLRSIIDAGGLKKYISVAQGNYYDKLCTMLSKENELNGHIIKFKNIRKYFCDFFF